MVIKTINIHSIKYDYKIELDTSTPLIELWRMVMNKHEVECGSLFHLDENRNFVHISNDGTISRVPDSLYFLFDDSKMNRNI